MKRFGNLFDVAFSHENLHAAYLDARRGKRGKRACFRFELNLGGNLRTIHDALHHGTYNPKPYRTFTVHEPKPRLIRAPAFEDTIVQHAIYRVIYPIFDRTFIATSFACRKGYGTHKASQYTQWALRRYGGDLYTLKLDVRRFFYSIDREILRSQIERKIKDRRIVGTMMQFALMEEPVGIPIGNLLSQLFALIYLNPLDHHIKRELKISHYVRYVDDMVLMGLTRDQCLKYRRAIEDFLRDNLRLELSKSTIQKIKKGINFVGYRTWRSKRFIRKYSLYKFGRMARRGDRQAIVSLLGHAKQTHSMPCMLRTLRSTCPRVLSSLPKFYRRKSCLPTRSNTR